MYDREFGGVAFQAAIAIYQETERIGLVQG